jgi:hypothetical protein
MSSPGTDEALSALIASTKRVRRKLDLLRVAKFLDAAIKGLGSLQAVSETIGVSPEMLRQFACVKKLAPQVKRLIARRAITSVDVAYRLSKLSPADQRYVAARVSKGALASEDVRAIVALRKADPRSRISRITERVLASRAIKEYEARFVVPATGANPQALRRAFSTVVGEGNIRAFSVENQVGTLVVSLRGRDRLQEAAKKHKLTKRELIQDLVLKGIS